MAVGAYFAWRAFDQTIYTARTESIPESASLIINAGVPVIKDANGRIAEAGVSPALIYGVSLEPGHNGTAGQYNIAIARINSGDVWIIPQLEATAQNEFGLAAGDLGVVKDATTGYWYGSTADGGAQCRAIDYEQQPAGMSLGDTKAPVHVIFHQTKLQVV